MADLKGVVLKEFEVGSRHAIALSTDFGVYEVIFEKAFDLNGAKKIGFLNLFEKKGFLKKIFEFKEGSFAIFYPGFLVQPEEIEFDALSTLASIFEGVLPKESRESELFYAIRGIRESEDFKPIIEKFPKDIKAKFSFYPYIFNSTYGFFVKDALFFGRFPVTLEENITKAKILALCGNLQSYLILNKAGTFEERKLSDLDRKDLLSKRNEFVLLVYAFFDRLPTLLKDTHPHYEKFKFLLDNREIFVEALNHFLKDFRDVRKSIKKALEVRLEDLPHMKLYNMESLGFSIKALIKDNELMLEKGTPFIVFEKPPLNMRIFGVVRDIDFTTLEASVDYKVVYGEHITPLKSMKSEVKGISLIQTKKTPLSEFLLGKSELPSLDVASQDVLEKVSQNPTLLVIKGSFGTGKKFLIGEFLKNHPEKSVVIFSRQYYKALSLMFGNIVEHKVEKLDGFFDYIFYFDRSIDKTTMLNLSAFTENLIVITYGDHVPFEEKLGEDRIILLDKIYGFDKSIYHFVNRFYPISSNFTQTLEEIKIINKDNIDKAFIPVVNPEKIVQFVSIKGSAEYKRNRLNKMEAEFTVMLIEQFLKGGVERSSISVVVPYERQKAYILHLLNKNSIDGVSVGLVDESVRRPIAIINFVDETLPKIFEDRFNLAYAITRGSSKVVLVGSPSLGKKEKFLT